MKKMVWFLLGWFAFTAIVLGAFIFFKADAIPTMLMVVYSVGAVAQLGLSAFCFHAAENRKKFHGASLRLISSVVLIAYGLLGVAVSLFELSLILLAVGLIVLLILQYIVYAFSVEVKPDAVEVIENTAEEIGKKTAFIRDLTVKAQNLTDKCTSEKLKSSAEAVYEALRYSDPVSQDALKEVEAAIKKEFCSFADALTQKNTEEADAAKEKLLALIKERNNTCKALK